MSKFEVKLIGKLDKQQTVKNVKQVVKEVEKQTSKLEIKVDVNQLKRSNKYLSTEWEKLAKQRIKLEADIKNNVLGNNEKINKSITTLLNTKRKELKLIAEELQQYGIMTDKAIQAKTAVHNLNNEISKLEAKKNINIKIASNKQGDISATDNRLVWSKNQEAKVTNELITLEGKLANSRKLSRSAEAQALQTTLAQQKENIRLYREEIKANGTKTDDAKKYRTAIEETNGVIRTQKAALKVLENQSLNVWERLTEKARDYFNYAVAAMTLQKAGQVVREMVTSVTELDASLVELRKVTDLEGESLDRFVDKAYNMSASVAKTGKEMIDATTEFAKSGYNPDAALELGEIALMYGNIADEEVSAGEAANFIIAQMKAFNIEASDAMHIIDAVNEVSNNFAVSSADIANNLGKASAVMANAGNSIEEYIAMMTAITEITRSADKAANGLKTLTLRLQGMNDEGEKDLEVQAKMEALFNKLGISVYKANGELKNTYEIMGTLAPIYQTLTNAEKAYVTETIAGKYQAQNAAALLNNWTTAVEANATAINSQGSAINENAKVLNSIEGRINAFQSSFQELAKNIINSDLIKGVVDLGNSILQLLNVADGAIPKFALLAGAIMLLWQAGNKLTIQYNLLNNGITLNTSKLLSNKLAQIALSKAQAKSITQVLAQKGAIDKNTKSLTNKTKKEIAAKLSAMGLTREERKAAFAAIEQAIAEGTATKATWSLKAAWDALTMTLKSNPLGLILTIGAGAIAGIKTLIDKAEEQKKEALQDTLDSIEERKNEEEQLEEISASIERYKEILNSSNSTLDEQISAKEELKKIQETLIEQYGQEANGIDLVNNSLEEEIKKVRELRQENAQLWLDNNYKQIKNAHNFLNEELYFTPNGVAGDGGAGDVLEGSKTAEVNDEQASILASADIETYTTGGGSQRKMTQIGGLNGLTIDEMINKLNDYYDKVKEWARENGKLQDDDVKSTLNAIREKTNALTDNEDYKNSTKIIQQEYREQLNAAKGYYDFVDEANKYSGKITDETLQNILNQDKYSEVRDAMDSLGITANDLLDDKDFTEFKGKMDAIKNAAIDVYDEIAQKRRDAGKGNSADELFKEIGSQWNPSYVEDLYNGAKELAESGKLTKKSLTDLMTAEGNWTIVNGEATYGLDGTKVALEDVMTYFSQFNKIIKENSLTIEGINKTLDGIQSSYSTVTEAIKEYNSQGYMSIDTLQALNELSWEHLQYMFDENGQLQLNEVGFRNLAIAQLENLKVKQTEQLLNFAKTLSEETQETKNKETAVDNLTQALSENNNEYAKAILLSQIDKDLSEDQIKRLEERIKKVAAFNQLIDGNIKKIRSGTASLKSSKSSSKSEKEWWEKELEALKNQFNYNEITIEEYINGLDKLLGKTKKGSEAWKKINEELQKQRLSKVEDDYKAGRISLEQYIAKLKELLKAYKQGTEAWNELAEKIKKGLQNQAKETKTSYDDAKTAIDKVIDDEINKLQEEIDLLKEKNDEKERDIELTRLKDALENAKRNKTKRIWNGSEWVWMADQDAIDDAQQALDDFLLDDKAEAIQKQIDDLTELKNQYADVTKIYDQEQQKQQLIAMLGANAEADILNQRIDTLNKFKDKYLAIQKQIADYDKATPESLAGGSSPSTSVSGGSSGSGSSSSNSSSLSEAEINKLAKEVISGKYGNGQTRKNALGANYRVVQNRVNQMLRGRSYASGGIIDYTGLAMLHGSPSRPEVVMNYDQIKNLMTSISRPSVQSNLNNSGQSIVYNFSGDFNLPNVDNAQKFLRDLKASVNIKRHSI